MATNDPKSRLTESSLNNPSYNSPNGITESRGNAGGTAPGVSGSDVGRREDETAGEKIGRFFRRAMERLSGREDWDQRRDQARDERTRDEFGHRTGSPQVGRLGESDRSQSELSDLGRSRDDRSQGSWSAPSGGSDERFPSGTGSGGYGQGTTGQPYGQGQGRYGQGSSGGQGVYAQSRYGQGGYGYGQERYGQGGQGGDERGRFGAGGMGEERGFRSEQEREDGNRRDRDRGDWRRQERWGERTHESVRPSFGVGRDEQRSGEWGEMDRDRDRGQGRRFWQREPLAARDVMTRNPKTVTRESSIREAAVIMRDENCGVVPVSDAAGRLEGLLTDRDIVVRELVSETFAQRRVQDVMTDDISAVTEDEPLTSVLDLMGRKQIRRVPVVDRNDRLLGIISMADIANRADYDEDLQDAFERISSRRSFWSLFS